MIPLRNGAYEVGSGYVNAANTRERISIRTTQEPDALSLSCFREHLHTHTLAGVDIIFLPPLKPNFLGV
jgi:hypothetical protein